MPIPKLTNDQEKDFENISKWLIEIGIFHATNPEYPDKKQAKELKVHADKLVEKLNDANDTQIWFKLYEIEALLSIRIQDKKQADFYLGECFSMLEPGIAMGSIKSGSIFRSTIILDYLESQMKSFAASGWSDDEIYKYYNLAL